MTTFNTVIGGGSGDEVEAYALGDAKNAVAGDKVILNAAATMFPSEPEIDFTGAPENTSNWKQAAYCDRELVTLGRGPALGYINAFKRDASGKYVYSKYYASRGVTGYGYGMFGSAIDFSYSDIYINFSSTGYRIGYQAALSFSSDYKYALATSSESTASIYVFKRLARSFSYVNKATTTTYRKNALGIVKVGNTYYAIKPTSKTAAAVYSITDSNDLSLVSSSIPITGSLPFLCMGFWRIFDNESKAVIYVPPTDYDGDGYSVNEAIFVVDINYTDGVPSSIRVNTGLTSSLRSAGSFITAKIKISVVDDRDIYVWGTGGCAAVRYDNSVSSFKIIPVPFPDIPYVDTMFVHPKDKIAIIQPAPTTAYIRELDAPVDQLYVATKPADGNDLSFPTVSLTGIVKENNSGILTVETVEDPNNPPHEYPDTYGLGYTVDSGGEVVLNGVIVGSPTVSSDNVMSGFSTTNYLELPASVIPSGGEPWTFVTKFNCTSVSSEQGILGYRGYGLFRISINGGMLNLGLSTATSSWNVGTITGSTTLSNNTDYWVKAEFTGSAYKLYLSTDGSTYNEEGTLTTSSVPTWPTVLTYGIMSQLAFNGSLYAQEAYLEVDGERVWKGTKVNSGSVAINWGWYKSSGIYYKYSGGTATLDNVQGDKATTMNLYIAADAEGTVTPVITTSEPLGYVSSHLLGKVYLSDTLDYFVDAPV